MDESLARWLVGPEGAAALAAAAAQPDPSSLAAATALRRRWAPEEAAAALSQEHLRRRAVRKLGESARSLFLTPTGLEQATRPAVAAWRAGVLADSGAHRIVDLGCGLGLDALALLRAGLAVVAVERDPVTAVFAAANLAQAAGPAPAGTNEDAGTLAGVDPALQEGGFEVVCADAVSMAADLFRPGDAVFLDPARRSDRGRSWRLADLSPSWEFVRDALRDRVGCVKLGPGFPLNQLPDDLGATWVSERGDLVELTLWSQAGFARGSRRAVLLPAGDELEAGERRDLPVGEVGRYLYEPDPAVIRSGGVAALADQLDGWALSPGIAYLASDALVATPFATAFEVLETFPWDERHLRAWTRDHDIGTLEIKVRGLDVDPAELRKRLKLRGRGTGTVVHAPTSQGGQTLVVKRV
jgi:SAM-dependent methyltransferase